LFLCTSIYAFEQEDVEIIYKGQCYHLNDILVDKFCPSDLIAPGTSPLLLEPQENLLQLAKESAAVQHSANNPTLHEASRTEPRLSLVREAQRMLLLTMPILLSLQHVFIDCWAAFLLESMIHADSPHACKRYPELAAVLAWTGIGHGCESCAKLLCAVLSVPSGLGSYYAVWSCL
jgi:hypothetical protein